MVGVGAQVGELAGSAGGYERHRVGASEGVGKDAGVDDGGVWAVVGAARDDDAEAVVEGHQVGEGRQVDHGLRPVIGPARRVGLFGRSGASRTSPLNFGN